MPSGLALGALAYQTIWVVSVTFVIWFVLIARYSASRLSAAAGSGSRRPILTMRNGRS
jgi:preprotein translocase subunit SecG